MLRDLQLQTTQREPHRALVLSRPVLSLSRSTDRDRNLHSLFHRFQSSRLGHPVRPTILRLLIFECKHVKS